MMSSVKVRCSPTYDLLLSKVGELSMELYALKLTLSFQQQLAHLPSSWLVNEVISLSYIFAKQQAKTSHKSITMWMTSWGVSHHVDNSTTSKITLDNIKKAFLAT